MERETLVSAHDRIMGTHRSDDDVRRVRRGSPPRVRGTPVHSTAGRRLAGAHPRGCGEHTPQAEVPDQVQGSPPRVRGTRSRQPDIKGRIGLTPAGAGNTARHATSRTGSWAHPRGCGEHSTASERSRIAPGSPPRVRGTPRRGLPGPAPQGLTPAGAGNTGTADGVVDAGAGSPPRVRGTLERVGERIYSVGLTPAGAGNTGPLRTPRSVVQAHPRGCGEHWTALAGVLASSGSPPRVRGTQSAGLGRGVHPGLTPAGAGNTGATWSRKPRRSGSPPRVRGTRPGLRRRRGQQGLTPAGAGNTTRPRRTGHRIRAHPRGCGEHVVRASAAKVWNGSPPRVRGTLAGAGRGVQVGGLTPAGAGNTCC